METIENIQKELKNILSEERYQHSIGVMKKAEELAKQYGVDANIAALTGIAHDIAKEIPNEEKITYCKEHKGNAKCHSLPHNRTYRYGFVS